MKKEIQIGIGFLVLAVISLFLLSAVICPMYSPTQYTESAGQGNSVIVSCFSNPLIELALPVIFVLIAVYFFWKTAK
jgi:hypothetical protein